MNKLEQFMLRVAAEYGIEDPYIVVTPSQYKDLKAAGFPEHRMKRGQKLPIKVRKPK